MQHWLVLLFLNSIQINCTKNFVHPTGRTQLKKICNLAINIVAHTRSAMTTCYPKTKQQAHFINVTSQISSFAVQTYSQPMQSLQCMSL
uniref:Putative secreted protein n=1 Tax=Ixodes ricinus TaxID=34613 RepID=A0A6B0U0C1_IXORI